MNLPRFRTVNQDFLSKPADRFDPGAFLGRFAGARKQHSGSTVALAACEFSILHTLQPQGLQFPFWERLLDVTGQPPCDRSRGYRVLANRLRYSASEHIAAQAGDEKLEGAI